MRKKKLKLVQAPYTAACKENGKWVYHSSLKFEDPSGKARKITRRSPVEGGSEAESRALLKEEWERVKTSYENGKTCSSCAVGKPFAGGKLCLLCRQNAKPLSKRELALNANNQCIRCETTVSTTSLHCNPCSRVNKTEQFTELRNITVVKPEIVKYYSKNNIVKANQAAIQNHEFLWNCDACGKEFSRRLDKALKSVTCNHCGKSSGEVSLGQYLRSLDEEFRVGVKDLIAPYELDFYYPERKLAIEYNGDYFHSDRKIGERFGYPARDYHEMKRKKCSKKGVKLAFVWECDLKAMPDVVKRDLKQFVETGRRSALLSKLTGDRNHDFKVRGYDPRYFVGLLEGEFEGFKK